MRSRPFVPNAQGGAPAASDYWSCYRFCDDCGVAYSNAARNPVLIHRDPAHNVPKLLRDGLVNTLGQALNRLNRRHKLDAFCSENSEDAVTWTVFRYLQTSGLLPSALRRFGMQPEDAEPTMLLWGAPVPLNQPAACRLRRALMDAEDVVGEESSSRTEPDVVLDLGDAGIVVIEVKLKSGPDIKTPDYAHWNTYLPSACFQDSGKAKESGLYELVRNWRIGCELAGG